MEKTPDALDNDNTNNRVIGGIAIRLSLPLPGCRERLRRSLCIPWNGIQ